MAALLKYAWLLWHVGSLFELYLLLKLNVRGKNKKEKLGGLFKGLAKGVDEVLISGQKVNLELTYVYPGN